MSDAATDRLTGATQQALRASEDAALDLRHGYIGTEHLLLGLARQQGDAAAEILRGFGLTPERVRGSIVRIVGAGSEPVSADRRPLPATPRLKKVLQEATRERVQHGIDDTTTEHLLLALVRDGEGVATKVLIELEVPLGAVEVAVTERMRAAA
jgi:ATP-dependent Clp protease ATP-binding subunit ClpC